jgi:hypothetical protein
VRVLHAALDAAPADLASSLQPAAVLSSAAFGDQTGYTSVPQGEQNLVLVVRGAGSVSTAANIASGESFSLLLFESNQDRSLGTSLISNAPPPVGGASAALRVIDGARGTDVLSVTINGAALEGGVAHAQASSYAVVPAGAVNVTVAKGGAAIYSGTLTLLGGGAYSLLVAGEAGYFVGARLYQD